MPCLRLSKYFEKDNNKKNQNIYILSNKYLDDKFRG